MAGRASTRNRPSVELTLISGSLLHKDYGSDSEAEAVARAVGDAIRGRETLDLSAFAAQPGERVLVPWFGIVMIRLSGLAPPSSDPAEEPAPWSE